MLRKLVLFWLVALTTPALASENLVDRDDNSSSGSILNLFGSLKNPFGGSSSSGDRGCEPQINAAGNAVYVRREGCPPPPR